MSERVERVEGTCEICGGELPDHRAHKTIHGSPEDCVWALQEALKAAQEREERLRLIDDIHYLRLETAVSILNNYGLVDEYEKKWSERSEINELLDRRAALEEQEARGE